MIALAIIAGGWGVAVVFTLAVCRAAARRPAYGPPVATTAPARRTSDQARSIH